MYYGTTITAGEVKVGLTVRDGPGRKPLALIAMNPHEPFCPTSGCPARGTVGAGNIVSHSQKEQRCTCTSCGRTFSIRKGTALYGIKHSADLFVVVVTLLAHGCPLQAIAAAFGLDERTVRSWYLKAGAHCQQVHEQIVGHSQLDWGQVQRRTATRPPRPRAAASSTPPSSNGLNATFRQCLACWGRRSRSLARQARTLQAGMCLVGCVYNLCNGHASLRLPLWISQRRCHWVQRTPAMAAGLTDHRWSVLELLTFKVPPPPFVPPKRRGGPPKRILQEAPA